jgi:hypothetical protein
VFDTLFSFSNQEQKEKKVKILFWCPDVLMSCLNGKSYGKISSHQNLTTGHQNLIIFFSKTQFK